ncbi:MAG: hypothetical protein H7A20_11230 [Rhodanobacteraceae bacterium]|nr:hypothetical protein [Rhodanobacteraceae bacterium]HPF71996.1 hypothetical protein [Xanthomonadaceae bacterium]HRX98853.1 hypothetical protein [Xanthomonadaceae bacterium]
MEKAGLIIVVALAGFYALAMLVFSIAALPFGIIPLLALIAAGLFFAKAVKDKAGNTEDRKYDDQVEP